MGEKVKVENGGGKWLEMGEKVNHGKWENGRGKWFQMGEKVIN